MNTENAQVDHRLELMNELLKCSHGNLAETQKVHDKVIESNPLFYRSMAAWYEKHGEVRDSKEVFSTTLSLHEDPDFREVGLALLENLPPIQVQHVVDWIKGTYVKEYNKVVDPKTKKTRRVYTGKKVKVGLGKNIPRSMRSTIEGYLRDREASPDWFDSAVLTARKSLKRLYAVNHICPSDRADQILFKNAPPTDSKLSYLKELAKSTDPVEQARLIIEHKIPYRVASSVVSSMTPTVLLALINSMSSSELINSMNSIKLHGCFDNPDLQALVKEKLKVAKGDKKVSALKSLEAVKAAGLSDEMNESLNEVADSQVKSKGCITRPTALLVDKSLSMNIAIELGKQIAAMISSVMAEGVPLYVYAFDVLPHEIKCEGKTLADWTKAFKHINANCGTSLGVGMKALKNNKQKVEQVLIISDEGHNTSPPLLQAYNEYCEAMNVRPSVHMLRCGGFVNEVSAILERAGVEISKYDIKGEADYYSLPQIVTYLTRPSKLDLLMEILNFPLPKRKVRSKTEKVSV